LELSAAWHARYAQSAHNRAVAMFVDSLHDPLLRSLERTRAAAPSHGAHDVGEHRALTEAITARDVEQATELMGRHLNRTAEWVGKADGAAV
jgi:DNA-binding FadR family transcriptional regulator